MTVSLFSAYALYSDPIRHTISHHHRHPYSLHFTHFTYVPLHLYYMHFTDIPYYFSILGSRAVSSFSQRSFASGPLSAPMSQIRRSVCSGGKGNLQSTQQNILEVIGNSTRSCFACCIALQDSRVFCTSRVNDVCAITPQCKAFMFAYLSYLRFYRCHTSRPCTLIHHSFSNMINDEFASRIFYEKPALNDSCLL